MSSRAQGDESHAFAGELAPQPCAAENAVEPRDVRRRALVAGSDGLDDAAQERP